MRSAAAGAGAVQTYDVVVCVVCVVARLLQVEDDWDWAAVPFVDGTVRYTWTSLGNGDGGAYPATAIAPAKSSEAQYYHDLTLRWLPLAVAHHATPHDAIRAHHADMAPRARFPAKRCC